MMGMMGFRINAVKKEAEWESQGGVPDAFGVLGAMSGNCDATCVFCEEKHVTFERDHSLMSLTEAETGLNNFSSQTGRCSFLKNVRLRSPKSVLVITTNGSCLTGEIISQLKGLKPIMIKLSVNAAGTDERKGLMGIGKVRADCLDVMASLMKAEIPFIGCLVAWPGQDLSQMGLIAEHMLRFKPYGIRVRLPLVHKYIPMDHPMVRVEPLDEFWARVYDWVCSLKHQIGVPLWVEPIQYRRVPMSPVVDGVILNSPAMVAGVREGDRLVRIDDQTVDTRADACKLFGSGKLDGLDRVMVTVRRGDRQVTFNLEHGAAGPAKNDYPYDAGLNHPGEKFGMRFLPEFDLQYIDNIYRLVLKYKAKSILFCCSTLTVGTLEGIVDQVEFYKDLFKGITLWTYVPEGSWMGGGTGLADSRMVADYEAAILKFIEQSKGPPDLILIPNVLGSSWGIDFTGGSMDELQYRFGIPIEMVPWHYVSGK